MTDSLLQEVDEALRADRAAALWNKHKSRVMALVVALIVAAAGDSVWQHYRVSRGEKILTQLVENQQLLESGKAAEAAKGFGDVAQASDGAPQSLALIWQARALVAANRKDEAVAALAAAATGASLWADLACLRLAALDEAAARPCLGKPTASPLTNQRAQWNAAAQWQAGDAAAAKATLEKLIADEATGQETRTRLTQWLALMKASEGKK